MEIYELTTWIGEALIDREQLLAASETEARSFARGVATERIRHNPVALARLETEFHLALVPPGCFPTRLPETTLGRWYLSGDPDRVKVGWKQPSLAKSLPDPALEQQGP